MDSYKFNLMEQSTSLLDSSYIPTQQIYTITSPPRENQQKIYDDQVDLVKLLLQNKNHDQCKLQKLDCVICQGKGKVNQNHFIQFVESIILYKFKGITHKRKEINHLKIFEDVGMDVSINLSSPPILDIRSNNQKLDQGFRFHNAHNNKYSMQSSMMNSSINPNMLRSYFGSNLYDNDSNLIIHNGIQCDECRSFPLSGPRYKCKICDNYDNCKQCAQKNLHHHDQWQIIASPQRKYSKNVKNLINHQVKVKMKKMEQLYQIYGSFISSTKSLK